MFKGYVEIKDKKAIEPFKNVKKLKLLEEMKGDYAGVLKENIILIDVDDYEQSEILFNILQDQKVKSYIVETTRGKHFYFKNTEIKKCKTNTKLVVGLTADIKSGFTNCYGVLKSDGKKRRVLQDDDPGTLPTWLYPINTKYEFLEMESGEGRNDALFSYILPLQSMGLTKEEIREAITLMNSYVLKDPLDQNELDTILRDDAFSKEIFFQGKQFLFDKFAHFIISNDYVIRLNNQLHVYKDGVYINHTEYIERKMIEYIPRLTKARRNEVLSYINLLVEDRFQEENENLIAFRNGIYNLVTDELMDFSPEYVITNKIDWDYNPEAYNALTDRTLDRIACFDSDVRSLLEEMIGYCFYRRNELRKAFVLVGDTVNGKSTYLATLIHLLGYKNISALDLNEIDGRFKTAELFGKLANIGDDIEEDYIANTGILKKLISGERLNVERKGQDPFEFNNYSKFIFSANTIPRIGSGKDSAAISNRLIVIPFNARFTKEDPDFDPFIKYKLRDQLSIEYLIKLGIESLKRILSNNSFTQSKVANERLREYELMNNPALEFVEQLEKVENMATSEVYTKYKEFCLVNGYTPIAHNNLSKFIKKYFKLKIVNKRIDGKVYKTYVCE